MGAYEKKWRTAVLSSSSSVEDAIASLNNTGLQIVLVLGQGDILLGTVTDGDIRRALLRGLTLDCSIEGVMRTNFMLAPPEMSRDMVRQLMRTNRLRQLPIVDISNRVIGLHLWDEINVPAERSNLMVIMAGGLGTRLLPHTEKCPKPMLPVAGKPMLEHIINHAKAEGFRRFIISVQYLEHVVKEYFGHGERLDVSIEYLKESMPLGTAGGLSLLSPRPETPFIVTNGDVLSDIKYGELLDFHLRHCASATMTVQPHEWQHPFGVVQTDGVEIVGVEEKPIWRTHINAGIYALSPNTLDFISENVHIDMPSLFEALKMQGERLVAYPMHEPWLDVGNPEDLQRARASYERGG